MKTEKDIKDYLHLYMKSWCQLSDISSAMVEDNYEEGQYGLNGTIYHYAMIGDCKVKLFLRPLSDMDRSEAKMMLYKSDFFSDHHVNIIEVNENPFIGIVYEIQYNDVGRYWKKQQSLTRNLEPQHVRFLISKGFDLFGLIEAGLAIDKSTLNQEAK